ncbi:MAG: calcium-binding protein, partial [Beijerinckiaceae bacterium]
ASLQRLRAEVISGGTTVIDETLTDTGTSIPTWLFEDRAFTALGATTTVRFSDVSTITSSVDLRLDHVRVTAEWNGNDTLAVETGTGDMAYGGGGNDVLSGSSGTNGLYGGAGDDTIEGGLGDDRLVGGAGSDTLSYASHTGNLTLDLAAGTMTISGDQADSFDGFEHVTGGGGNDSITGNSTANVLTGGGGDDTLSGGLGADTMIGGSGNDVIYGDDADVITTGLGNDIIYLDGSALTSAATDIQAGGGAAEGLDKLFLTGSGTINLAQLVAGVSGIESIDVDVSAMALQLSNFGSADAIALLGVSGPGQTLELDLDANDVFSAQVTAGQSLAVTGGNLYTFYNSTTVQDATTEIARVQIM